MNDNDKREDPWKTYWKPIAQKQLVGRKIVKLSWDNKFFDEEYDDAKILNLHLDDGQVITASQDDEGNGPGTFFTSIKPGVYL
jgi:hypothetical protein